MNQYVVDRIATIDASILTDSGDVPQKPTVSYTGLPSYPLNALTFSTGAFSSPASESFAAMEWRIAEVTDATAPGFDPNVPRKYEINEDWETGEITTYASTISIPGDKIDEGDLYRVRVRMKDTAGLWSHWSDPHEFTAGSPTGPQIEGLRITELMYNPADPTPADAAAGFTNNDDFEFIVLRNISASPLDLTGVRFTNGIDYTFPSTTLAAGERIVVPRNASAFAQRYDTTGLTIAPEYRDPVDGSNKLKNSDESIELTDATGGTIHDFHYYDSWHPTTDGDGYSLVIIDDGGLIETWDTAAGWQASPEIVGAAKAVASWLASFGLASGSDMEHDTNGDGVPLLMAYALDLNPNLNLGGSLPMAKGGDGALSITFYGASLGITYTVETSSNLKDWTTQGVTLSGTDMAGYRTASVDLDLPRCFLRLTVND